jgi:citrate synthase
VLAVPRTGLRTDGRLSSAEAAAYLGVRRSTLHTYVSRGLLHSERQSDGRMSTFDAEELARFAATRRSRQKGQS